MKKPQLKLFCVMSLSGVRHGLLCDPGNSHRRSRMPLLAIPDAPPACFAHWAQFIVPYLYLISGSCIFFQVGWDDLDKWAFQPKSSRGISFGIRQRPTLPGVRRGLLCARGTRIVAAGFRSLRFPTLRLPVSPTGRGRLRSHGRRPRRYRQVLCANSFTSLAEQSLHRAGETALDYPIAEGRERVKGGEAACEALDASSVFCY